MPLTAKGLRSCHKSRAASYTWNERNIESPWYALYDAVFREVLKMANSSTVLQRKDSALFVVQQDSIWLPKGALEGLKKKANKQADTFQPSQHLLNAAVELGVKTRAQRKRENALMQANVGGGANVDHLGGDDNNEGNDRSHSDAGDTGNGGNDGAGDDNLLVDQEDGDDLSDNDTHPGAPPLLNSPPEESISVPSAASVRGTDGFGVPDFGFYFLKGKPISTSGANKATVDYANALGGYEIPCFFPLGFAEIKSSVSRKYSAEDFAELIEARLEEARDQLVLYIDILFRIRRWNHLQSIPVIAAAGPFWQWTIVERGQHPGWNHVQGCPLEDNVEAKYQLSFTDPVELLTEGSDKEFRELVGALVETMETIAATHNGE